MAYNWTTEWPGVYAQHASDCPLRSGGDCTCARIAYRASAKAPDERSRLLSPEFGSAVEARNWLRDQRARVTAATTVADEGPSLNAVIQDFLAAASRGLGRQHPVPGASPERLRQVRDGLGYVGADLGSRRIQSVRRRHVQALIDQFDVAGMPADRVNNVISSLRVLFAYAIQRDLVDFNPIVQLTMPTPPVAKPAWPEAENLTPYYTANGHGSSNGNGNGNGNGPPQGEYGDATEPYTPVFTSPFAPPATAAADETGGHWSPGVSDGFDFDDIPFEVEPPPPVPGRAPWVAADPLDAQPYPAEALFAPPASAMPAMPAMGPPLTAAETRYGTPVHGTEAVTTQAPAKQEAAAGPADNTLLSEQMFWWITRIVVIVFVLIALVLAAESV
jgi:hypothetical protein